MKAKQQQNNLTTFYNYLENLTFWLTIKTSTNSHLTQLINIMLNN